MFYLQNRVSDFCCFVFSLKNMFVFRNDIRQNYILLLCDEITKKTRRYLRNLRRGFVGRRVRTVLKAIYITMLFLREMKCNKWVMVQSEITASHSQIVNFAAKTFHAMHSSSYNLTENVYIVRVVGVFGCAKVVIVFLERGGGCDTLTSELVCLPSLFSAKIT